MKAGWEVRPLGDAATFVMGQAPAGSDCNKDGIGTPFVKAGEFGESRPIIREWTTDPKKFAKNTDVLICVVGATCGKINLGADCAIGRSAAAIRPKAEKLDQFYLHYYLEGQVEKFRAGSVGAAQTVISRDMLSGMAIPLPPLEEQQRIVAVLDEAFEGLTRARAHAEANLQNARELFAGAIAQEFSDLGNAPRKKVGDVARHSLGKMLDKSKNKGVPRGYLRNINVRWFEIDTSDILEMRIEEHELEKYSVKCGDLLICEGGYPGRCSIWDQDEVMFFQKALHRVRFDHDVYGRLLMFFLFMEDQSGSLKENFSGSGIQHFTGQALAKFEMPYPSLDTAEAMVSRIEAIRSASGELEAKYAAKLQSIDALRQTLLQKAFAGELTG